MKKPRDGAFAVLAVGGSGHRHRNLADPGLPFLRAGVVHRYAVGVDRHGHGHVLHLQLVDGFHAHVGKTQPVIISFGTNQLTSYRVGPNDAFSTVIGTNSFLHLEIVPITVGTNQLLGLAVTPGPQAEPGLGIQIINLSPAGSFIVATKVAFYGGLVISAPLILYFIAQFVFPALKLIEKKYVYRGILFGAGLFMTGVCFCYFVLMPVALAASVQYAEWLGFSAYQWRAEDYVGFVCNFRL